MTSLEPGFTLFFFSSFCLLFLFYCFLLFLPAFPHSSSESPTQTAASAAAKIAFELRSFQLGFLERKKEARFQS